MLSKSPRQVLLKNTIMLYVLTFSNYLLSFIIVPYETRVLGTEYYGLIGLVAAITTYYSLFIEFGFVLSATEEVAGCRDDKARLSKIFSSVTANKIVLSVAAMVVVLAFCMLVPRWREHIIFVILSCIASSLGSLIPDYLYRGIEKMGAITGRAVSVRVFFTLMVFIFVKEPADYILIPILQIIGHLLSLIVVYMHLKFKLDISFVKVSLKDVFSRMKVSVPFFISRIATTMYSAANTIILDLISGGAMTAFYTSADKLVSTAKSGLSPVSDSLYPYMIKNKDFKLVKKVILLIEPVIILGCVIVFVFAEPLCTWFFGSEYTQTAYALRALLPIVAIILPSYIFGFPTLGAMGLSKHANISIIVASSMHVINLIVLYSLGVMNIVTLGIATSVTETVVLVYRLIIVVKNRHLFNGVTAKEG